MFQRILVPLDGSTRAERALPVAAKIARASGGSVVLLRVIAPVPIASNRYMSGISIGGLYGPAIEVPPAVNQEAHCPPAGGESPGACAGAPGWLLPG